jgi:maleate isomerase
LVDILGHRKKIGIVVPSTNTVVQPECELLKPRGVTNHVGRSTLKTTTISEQGFADHMRAMREGIDDAIEQLMTCRPDHLIFGVAIEAFSGGVTGAAQFQKGLAEKAGVGTTIGSTAAVAALKAFNARKIAVLTPHQPSGDEIVRNYLEEAGFDVVKLAGLKCPSPWAIAEVPPQTVRAHLRELNGDNIDAILQVGTNLANAATAAEAERWLGKPVLCLNVVSYWNALRTCGITDRIFGYGRILEEF